MVEKRTTLPLIISMSIPSTHITKIRLATLYFDRRMLTVAAKNLNRCRELAEVLVQLESVRQSKPVDDTEEDHNSAQVESNNRRKYERAVSRLSGIQTDIKMVKELQNTYCTQTPHVRVLPCLFCRFNEDNVRDCETWWTTIRTSDRFIW
jgi:hypothetical protein